MNATVIADEPAASDWYYATDDEPVGPVTIDDLVQLARRGELKGEDFVWAEGMAAWEPASSISKLWVKPPPLPLRPLSVIAGAPKRDGWIIEHWQGKLPLWISYWLVGVLLGLLLVIPLALSRTLLDGLEFPPSLRLSAVRLLVAALLFLWAWQLIGIWRAAGNHYDIKSGTWRRACAYMARLVVVFFALQIPSAIEAIFAAFMDGHW